MSLDTTLLIDLEGPVDCVYDALNLYEEWFKPEIAKYCATFQGSTLQCLEQNYEAMLEDCMNNSQCETDIMNAYSDCVPAPPSYDYFSGIEGSIEDCFVSLMSFFGDFVEPELEKYCSAETDIVSKAQCLITHETLEISDCDAHCEQEVEFVIQSCTPKFYYDSEEGGSELYAPLTEGSNHPTPQCRADVRAFLSDYMMPWATTHCPDATTEMERIECVQQHIGAFAGDCEQEPACMADLMKINEECHVNPPLDLYYFINSDSDEYFELSAPSQQCRDDIERFTNDFTLPWAHQHCPEATSEMQYIECVQAHMTEFAQDCMKQQECVNELVEINQECDVPQIGLLAELRSDPTCIGALVRMYKDFLGREFQFYCPVAQTWYELRDCWMQHHTEFRTDCNRDAHCPDDLLELDEFCWPSQQIIGHQLPHF